jgi:nicastrin
MHSSGTADVCIRRGQCQPLGGKSVWSSLGGNVSSSKKIVFVSTSLDSNAFFHDIAIGADAHISSVITLLLTAHTLSNVNMHALDKQIVLGLFAGESWGYLGSKKFVDDIVNFKCTTLSDDGNSCLVPYRPNLQFQQIKLSNIDLLIDIDQISNLGI